jgi:hypothetical protein
LDFKLAALAAAVFFVEEGQQQTRLLQGKPFVFGQVLHEVEVV